MKCKNLFSRKKKKNISICRPLKISPRVPSFSKVSCLPMLQDAITDLTADCEPLEIEGLENCVAHKGILQAAKYVKATIEKLHLLEQAFERAEVGI